MTATLAPPHTSTTIQPVDAKDTRVALWIVAALTAAALLAIAAFAAGRWYGYRHGETAGHDRAIQECSKGVDQNKVVQVIAGTALRVPRGSHLAACVVPD